MVDYRLGLDIGTNSIGWCALELDGTGQPCGILDLGVRIFPSGRDPQTGTSLAVDRRLARGARRNRDRYLTRRDDLMKTLVRLGLMPADEAERKALENLDPYELRARGLDGPLPPHHLGRALFHLHQRRGFASNRRTAGGGDEDSGRIKAGVSRLHGLMAESGARTLGEFLWFRHRERRSVRARLNGSGARAEYDLYPDRALVRAEFDALWTAQRRFGLSLGDEAADALRAVMFRQRPLRRVDPGRCTLDPVQERAPWALPLAQRSRILQELANLAVLRPGLVTERLDAAQRAVLLKELLRRPKLTFERARKLLGLPGDLRFNLEDARRDHLKGDATAAVLSGRRLFGARWHDFGVDRQTEIVERLLDEEDEEALAAWLCRTCGVSAETAGAVAAALLPQGYCRFGRGTLAALIPHLEAGLTYSDAARAIGRHHSDHRPEGNRSRLPYYAVVLPDAIAGTGDPRDGREKRWGRIANPTIHIGLNQLRRLVNALIDRWGKPREIVVELARELKLGFEQRQRREREQADNRLANDRRRDRLRELGLPDSGFNVMKLRLWEELNPTDEFARFCPYTGERISIAMLFADPPQVDIDHILPFSKTLDDGVANRVVALRAANRIKGNRTPWEAFGTSPTINGIAFDWAAISERAEAMPRNKRWRFQPDAMERFEAEQDFLARQLTDTAYLSRLAHRYLGQIVRSESVRVIPGRLTEMLRGRWGLNAMLYSSNRKLRTDHRHHAIDAFVVAVTSRSLLQRVARAADQERDRLIVDLPDPYDGFDHEEFRRRINGITVSYRLDHGTGGRLHAETAYGPVRDPVAEGGYNLVARKPLASLNENQIGRIRDLGLRAEVQAFVAAEKAEGRSLKDALARFAERRGIRRVRLLEKEEDVVWIRDRSDRPYKAYSPAENHRVEIFALPDGRWRGEGVTMFDANRPGFEPRWRRDHPDARLVMKVHKGDLLRLDDGDGERTMVVRQLEVKNGRLRLSAHNEAGNLQRRHDDGDDPFRWLIISFDRLRQCGARLVNVDVTGRVHRTGAAE
jgi:CRISPR-associated endonuclease Csn1